MQELILILAALISVPGGTIECKGDCGVRFVTSHAPTGQVSGNSYIIRNDMGGYIDDYQRKYAALRGKRIVVDGRCNSACTMVLSNPRACATARAVFGFHSAYTISNGRKLRSEIGNREISAHYPPKLRARLGRLSDSMVYIPGRQLLPLCG